jgi:hypothetical protein
MGSHEPDEAELDDDVQAIDQDRGPDISLDEVDTDAGSKGQRRYEHALDDLKSFAPAFDRRRRRGGRGRGGKWGRGESLSGDISLRCQRFSAF